MFLSYRHGYGEKGFDAKMVDRVFDNLSGQVVGSDNQRLDAFYDRVGVLLPDEFRAFSLLRDLWDLQVRLQSGRRFDYDFMLAMTNCLGVVPLVSSHALVRMASTDHQSVVDNVLLEWSLALELQKAGRLRFVLPILIGTIGTLEGKELIANLWQEKPLEKLPNVVPVKLAEKVDKFLRENGLTPSGELFTRTVRQVVEELTQNQALLTWKMATTHGGSHCMAQHDIEMFGLYGAVANAILELVNRYVDTRAGPNLGAGAIEGQTGSDSNSRQNQSQSEV